MHAENRTLLASFPLRVCGDVSRLRASGVAAVVRRMAEHRGKDRPIPPADAARQGGASAVRRCIRRLWRGKDESSGSDERRSGILSASDGGGVSFYKRISGGSFFYKRKGFTPHSACFAARFARGICFPSLGYARGHRPRLAAVGGANESRCMLYYARGRGDGD